MVHTIFAKDFDANEHFLVGFYYLQSTFLFKHGGSPTPTFKILQKSLFILKSLTNVVDVRNDTLSVILFKSVTMSTFSKWKPIKVEFYPRFRTI